MVHVSITPMNFLWLPLYLFIQNWNSICIRVPSALHFHLCFHLCCDVWDFVDISFPFFYRSLIMKSGLTCPLVIWPKLCITSSCNSRQIATLVSTQQHLTTTLVLSNNLHNINSTCKVVHQGMVLIRLNYCWRRFEGQVILLDLLQ
jgi:hypothetical protein